MAEEQARTAPTAEGDPSAPADGSSVPFDGYDDLTVPQVVDRLKDSSPEEVAAVKAYEADHDERAGVLNFKVDEPVADRPPVPDALDPGTIAVDRIPLLQGFIPPPDTVTKTGTLLSGDESPSGKVRVRTRYPVDIFDSGTLVITAEGVKVPGDELAALVVKARESGIELERI